MATRHPKTKTISATLRDAIADSEKSLKALGKETGVFRQSLTKFARGEQSLRLDMADKLAAYFDLELVKRKAK